MSGRIRDEDVRRVRELSPVDAVIREHLQLRPAGGSRFKALCPFHEERTPSFSVSADRGFWYCFGCGEGGDVIRFVEKIEHLGFAEAVESLARRSGVQLHYERGSATPGRDTGQRQRLLDAHAAAAAFYRAQLAGPAAATAREFLTSRGFPPEAVDRFAVGYAPAGWDTLVHQLRSRGFTVDELLTAGLAARGQRGPVDRFRDRVVWPIRDIKGDVVAFGARRLGADDTGPKYLNSPETPLFKKSQVLYGIDLAKADIARRLQAVVVEGYTDVMACHLAGVTTAVATCGTSFGTDHIAVLRRLLMDQDEFRGRVIFTFDGDEAGQKAALRAFEQDERFVTQTFVAVEPGGADPCELRLTKGDTAVRDLVANHVPLFEFAARAVLARYDLDLAEDRVAALHATAPVIARIKDWSLRDEYARRLAGWLGMDVDPVRRRVAEQAGGRPVRGPARRRPADPADPRLVVERELLKIAVQHPTLAGPLFDQLPVDSFTDPAHAAVRAAVAAAGGAGNAVGGQPWVTSIREAAPDDQVRALVTQLAVEAPRSTEEADPRYAASLIARLQEIGLTSRISEVSSKLQRLNPLENRQQYDRLFGDLIALEQRRRGLREQAIGAL